MNPDALSPKCPRCNLPLDVADTAQSHSGAVHPGCVRPDAARAPSNREDSGVAFERAAPKYGGPPLQRFVRSLLLLLPVVLLLVMVARRCG